MKSIIKYSMSTSHGFYSSNHRINHLILRIFHHSIENHPQRPIEISMGRPKMKVAPSRQSVFSSVETSIHRLMLINGMDMLKHPDFKRLIRYKFNIIQAFVFCLFYIYSWYSLRNEMLELAFSTCMAGFATQGVSIMFLYMFRSSEFRERFLETKEFYLKISPDPEEEAIKDRYCLLMKRMCGIYLIGYTSLVTLNVLWSVIGRLFFDERMLLFGLDMPWLDEKVSPDYEMVLLYQIVQDIYTWTNIVSFQHFFIILILHNSCLMEVLTHKMELPWEVRAPDNWERLREIIIGHQKPLKFFGGITTLFNIYNTTQLICTTLVAILIAYVLLFTVWIPGYVLMVLSLGMLFVNSIYGAYIEKKSGEFVDAIFHTLDWTVLTPNQRKIVLLLLRSAQDNTQLRCGGIFLVNYHTFLSVGGGKWKMN